MGLLVDLALLALYMLTFAVYSFVTIVQILAVARDGQSPRMESMVRLLLRVALATVFYFPVIGLCGRMLGYQLSKHSETRRQMILDRVFGQESSGTVEASNITSPLKNSLNSGSTLVKNADAFDVPKSKAGPSAANEHWAGIVGFFHPFCNAGGGGERVLWAAIKTTQDRYPRAICVVYTGDHESSKQQIISRVKDRFNIELDSTKLFFLYLSTRRFVLATTWPRFTLLGQSLGSIICAFDAFQLLVPDLFIDTMGYGFALGCAKFLFPHLPTGAYVHYPTISTDMLGSLDQEEGKGLHAGSGKGLRGLFKKIYWRLFAEAYSRVGGTVDVVMTNSSWTQGHIGSLWGEYRKSAGRGSEIKVVFPPCAVEELEDAIIVDEESEKKREDIFLCIAQFRPEKNHKLLLESFAEFLRRKRASTRSNRIVKLVLIGSVRDSEDAKRVYDLRLLSHELKIKEDVEFICDASWSDILKWLQRSTAGVNGMWNEHFGIGVVEYQAAGLISVVNDSGGPKMDIVIDYGGGPTGYHASSAGQYADALQSVLDMTPNEKLKWRFRARESAKRFTESEFAILWGEQTDLMLDLHKSPQQSIGSSPIFQLLASSFIAVIAYDIYSIIR